MADWYVRSGAAGSGNGTSWANAYTTLNAALAAKSGNDRFFVADDHNESGATKVIGAPGSNATAVPVILCVDRAGSVPPVDADLRTTAVIASTGSTSISVSLSAYVYGITFQSGTTGGVVNILPNADFAYFKKCVFSKRRPDTSSNGALSLGSNSVPAKIILDDCGYDFANVGDKVDGTYCDAIIRNSATPFPGAVIPTSFFYSTQPGRRAVFRGNDFSAKTSGQLVDSQFAYAYMFQDNKVDPGCSYFNQTPDTVLEPEYFISRSGTGGGADQYAGFHGTYADDFAVVRTGGASNGTTPRSLRIASRSTVKLQRPFEVPPIAIWNDTSGASKTATIEGIANAATMPTNANLWLDIEYLGDASSPKGAVVSGAPSPIATPAGLTASTQAWDSQVTARANSAAYALGDQIKLASNPGRVFFCTTAGNAAAAEPGGYATAIDGGSVNDGTAVFRAGWRFKIAVSFTPQQKGVVYGALRIGLASTTYYIDPLLAIV